MIPYDVSIRYMLAGYGAILAVQAIYLVSLFLRWKKIKREYASLQEHD